MRVTTRVTAVPLSPATVNCPRSPLRDDSAVLSARTWASLRGWPDRESLTTPLTEPVCATAGAGGTTTAHATSPSTLRSRGQRIDVITRGIGDAPNQGSPAGTRSSAQYCIQRAEQPYYAPRVGAQGARMGYSCAGLEPGHLKTPNLPDVESS